MFHFRNQNGGELFDNDDKFFLPKVFEITTLSYKLITINILNQGWAWTVQKFANSSQVRKVRTNEQVNTQFFKSVWTSEQVNTQFFKSLWTSEQWTLVLRKSVHKWTSELLFFKSLWTSEQVNTQFFKSLWTSEQVNSFFSVQCPAIFSLQTFEQMYLNFFVNYWIYEQDYVISGTWESMN